MCSSETLEEDGAVVEEPMEETGAVDSSSDGEQWSIPKDAITFTREGWQRCDRQCNLHLGRSQRAQVLQRARGGG